MTKEKLIKLLKGTIAALEQDDSFGGYINYQARPDSLEFDVMAQVRIGNSEGQGGMIVISDMAEIPILPEDEPYV